jgi:acid phosphatase type 7
MSLCGRLKPGFVLLLIAVAVLVLAALVGSSSPSRSFASTSADPVVMAAGDIACPPGRAVMATACRQEATSDLLSGATAVLTLGDNQYRDGTLAEFQGSFEASWGRFKGVMHPSAGNHEYHTAGAAGYFDYFGSSAGARGEGYYSFNLGSWHLIALNSNCAEVGGCESGSPQEVWLRSDLAANPAACVLAYWHHPRFSSGQHGGSSAYTAFWSDLYSAGADLVLVGHDHDYERFAPQTPDGAPDAARGIRQFVVGTGGKRLREFVSIEANSEVRNSSTFGVLKLVLHTTGYEWEFVPETGKTFTDSGSASCVT